MPNRKNVQWRVGEHSESDKINKWLDQQKNIQDSLTNIVLHMIERFGMQNITDYDIQKILYQESLSDNPIKKQTFRESSQSDKNVLNETETTDNKRDLNVNNDDDMYNEIDMDNL
ncbi:hypothetical protein [Virgibacillus salexigens]|uniref:hypothetical protein n=1 Tax=Virgibacillus massiliensis TaxID=1462526 RepID=UPI0013682932|nr:hypothetical protein [Virgibacillus massiliensis]MYL43980.1 hypothetical protein [Virgibacillus massiliensis]